MDTLDTIWDSPALYDSGHIGRMDIFIGGDASPGGPCGNWSWAGILRAIRVTSAGPQVRCGRAASIRSSSRARRSGTSRRRPHGARRRHRHRPVGRRRSRRTRCARSTSTTARRSRGWPVLLNGPIFGSPVIGDVNGDKQERRGRRRVRDVHRRTRVGVHRPRQADVEHGSGRRASTTPRSCRRRSSSTSTATA